MRRLVITLLLLAVLFVPSSLAVWILPMDSKICENDVIKSIADFSLVQCIASCRRSTECHTVSFTKNEAESVGKCLQFKEINGTCGNEAVANRTGTANTTKNEVVEKSVESAESVDTFRVKSGLLHFNLNLINLLTKKLEKLTSL